MTNVKQINLYHIGMQKIYKNVSLREQCYKNNFYGLDNENILAELEKSFSLVIKYILLNQNLPNTSTNAHKNLLAFVAVQITRTKKFAEDINSTIEKFNQLVLLRNKEQFPNLDVKKIRVGLKEPVLQTLPYSYKFFICIEDLNCHLLLANKNQDFITSDSPVFIYNKYIEDLKEAKNGLLSIGALIFIPLSPKVCLVLYDSSVYKIGKKNKNITCDLTTGDVFQINSLQFISADQVLYFNDSFQSDYFNIIHQKYMRKRESSKPKVLEYQEGEDINKSLVVNYFQMPDLNMNLSFLSLRRKAKCIKQSERNLKYRKPMPPIPGEVPNEYYNLPNEILGKQLKKINEL